MSNIVADVMTSFQSDLKRFSVTIAELSIAKLRLLKRKTETETVHVENQANQQDSGAQTV